MTKQYCVNSDYPILMNSVNLRKECQTIEKVEIINKNVRKNNNNDSGVKAQIQSVTNKLINARIIEINNEGTKNVSFKVSEANAESWAEEATKITTIIMVLQVLELCKS